MKKLATLALIAMTSTSMAQVTFDASGNILNGSTVIGEYTLVLPTGVELFIGNVTDSFILQGRGDDFLDPTTISLTVNSLDSDFAITNFSVASTVAVDGDETRAVGEGFNIGNGNDNNAADISLSFNVDGQFTLGSTSSQIAIFGAGNQVTSTGALAADDAAILATTGSDNHGSLRLIAA